jgi:hypothetical protein
MERAIEMFNIEQMQEKPQFKDITYLTSSGDEVTVRRHLCSICQNYMRSNEPHTACQRQVSEKNAMIREEQRKEQCLRQFGVILSPQEQLRRTYVNDSVEGTEPYAKQLEREAREKVEAEARERSERANRKRQLRFLEQQLRSLKARIANDERLEEEEAKKSQEQT